MRFRTTFFFVLENRNKIKKKTEKKFWKSVKEYKESHNLRK